MAVGLKVEDLTHAIETEVRRVIDRATEEEVAAAQKRLAERIPALTAEVATRVQSAFDAMGNETVLQIRIGRLILK